MTSHGPIIDAIWNFLTSNFVLTLIPVAIIITVLIIWYFNPFNSWRLRWTADKCLVRLCELTGKNYTVTDVFLVSLSDDKATKDNKCYVLDFTRSIKDSGGRSYLYFDIDNCLPLTTFETTVSIKDKKVKDEVVLGRDPDGNTTVKYTLDKNGKPLLWYNPTALDARLFMQIFTNEVWSRIGRSKLEKYALYIIVALVILCVAIAGLSAWQINNLTTQNSDLAKKIIDLLNNANKGSGGVTGG